MREVAAQRVAEGDVALPLAGVPFAVLLGIVLAVELAEGDCLGVVVMPSGVLADALLGIVGYFFFLGRIFFSSAFKRRSTFFTSSAGGNYSGRISL